MTCPECGAPMYIESESQDIGGTQEHLFASKVRGLVVIYECTRCEVAYSWRRGYRGFERVNPLPRVSGG